jgi:hypothetical protein
MQYLVKVLGGLAIVLIFFFGTLFVLDYFPGWSAYAPLRTEAKAIMRALQDYRAARGSYPVLSVPDNLMPEIKKYLASSGYPVSGDTEGTDKDARYFSSDGKSYGLLFHINRSDKKPLGDQCMIEVDIRQSGLWGQPAGCPF